MAFFADDDYYSGPVLTPELIVLAEARLGYRLPAAYLQLLGERNGGVPLRRCFKTNVATSWAPSHVEVSAIRGISGRWGVDSLGGLGSQEMIAEWGYPPVGIVICDTPSAGHDTIMLDYSRCGPGGEPSVVYVDEDRTLVALAKDFSAFIENLVDCEELS